MIWFIISTALAQTTTIPNNTVSIGKTGAANKIIEFNLTKSGASANPKIRWNNSSSKIQFSNDGTSFTDMGATTSTVTYGVGKYSGITNCTWSTTSGSYADFAADTDCSSKTVLGVAADQGDSEPEFNFTNVPAGAYRVTATGLFSTTYASSSTECLFRLYDGTNQIGVVASNAFSGVTTGYASHINGYVNYATLQSSVKIRVQGFRTTGGGACNIANNGSATDFQIILEQLY